MLRSIKSAICLVLCSFSIGYSSIINVPGDFSAIQTAIDSSSAGDTVLVQPGIYAENVNFNGHNVKLMSLYLATGDTSYISTTIIDGTLSGSVVTFVSGEDSTAILAGFTIKNGHSSTGGGICCINSSPSIMFNKIIENAAVPEGRGGGIYTEFAAPRIVGNYIAYNSASWDGGGIHCRYESSPEILDNVIHTNVAADSIGSGRGGGVYIYMADPVIKGNVMANNFTYGEWGGIGGGLCISAADAQLINNTVAFNTSLDGPSSNGTAGGLFFVANSSLISKNNIFWGDSAASYMEIYIDPSSTYDITYCDIEGGGWPGTGNLDHDPGFRNIATGDFHLMALSCGDYVDSYCIDAGDPFLMDRELDCNAGLGTIFSDMGAYGGYEDFIGCGYVIGDVNGSGGFNGLDITYGVMFFKGGPSPLCGECPLCPDWYYCGDVNGGCSYNGLDITYGVAYLRGDQTELIPCPDCPPIR